MNDTSTDHDLLLELRGDVKALDEKLDAVFEQTKKTNGRVTDLERRTDKIDVHNAYQVGEKKGSNLTWGRLFGVIAATGTLIVILEKLITNLK